LGLEAVVARENPKIEGPVKAKPESNQTRFQITLTLISITAAILIVAVVWIL
jgi:hypothetical protein